MPSLLERTTPNCICERMRTGIFATPMTRSAPNLTQPHLIRTASPSTIFHSEMFPKNIHLQTPKHPNTQTPTHPNTTTFTRARSSGMLTHSEYHTPLWPKSHDTPTFSLCRPFSDRALCQVTSGIWANVANWQTSRRLTEADQAYPRRHRGSFFFADAESDRG
jgi:hypothetical protein